MKNPVELGRIRSLDGFRPFIITIHQMVK